MNEITDVLTVLAAGGGLTVLLVMALAPLLVDRHGGRGDGPRTSAAQTVGGRA
jgi:hypothetical protein